MEDYFNGDLGEKTTKKEQKRPKIVLALLAVQFTNRNLIGFFAVGFFADAHRFFRFCSNFCNCCRFKVMLMLMMDMVVDQVTRGIIAGQNFLRLLGFVLFFLFFMVMDWALIGD